MTEEEMLAIPGIKRSIDEVGSFGATYVSQHTKAYYAKNHDATWVEIPFSWSLPYKKWHGSANRPGLLAAFLAEQEKDKPLTAVKDADWCHELLCQEMLEP